MLRNSKSKISLSLFTCVSAVSCCKGDSVIDALKPFVHRKVPFKKLRNYYRPQRSWGKVMFLQVCVILFTGGGVPDQVHPSPGTRYTPGPGTPPGKPPLGPGTPRQPGTPPSTPGPDTPPLDQVHPPDQVHPLGPGTPPTRYTPQDQVHPPTRYTPPPRDQGDTVYARAVRILLECNLVSIEFVDREHRKIDRHWMIQRVRCDEHMDRGSSF